MHTYFAYDGLNAWLGGGGVLSAAMAPGFPDGSPAPRLRRPAAEIIQWRD